jgi:hypothetical protein
MQNFVWLSLLRVRYYILRYCRNEVIFVIEVCGLTLILTVNLSTLAFYYINVMGKAKLSLWLTNEELRHEGV